MQLAVRNYNRFHVALAPVVTFWELGHDRCQGTDTGTGEPLSPSCSLWKPHSLPSRSAPHSLPSRSALSLGPDNCSSALHCFNGVTTRRFYKWNRTKGLLKLALFTRHSSLKIHPGCWTYLCIPDRTLFRFIFLKLMDPGYCFPFSALTTIDKISMCSFLMPTLSGQWNFGSRKRLRKISLRMWLF